jgi:hypothetical protein
VTDLQHADPDIARVGVPGSEDSRLSRIRAAALIAVWAGIVAAIVKLGD